MATQVGNQCRHFKFLKIVPLMIGSSLRTVTTENTVGKLQTNEQITQPIQHRPHMPFPGYINNRKPLAYVLVADGQHPKHMASSRSIHDRGITTCVFQASRMPRTKCDGMSCRNARVAHLVCGLRGHVGICRIDPNVAPQHYLWRFLIFD